MAVSAMNSATDLHSWPAVFAAIAAQRRSTRAFLSRPVPDPLLREIFAAAQLAPSNCNTQPWLVYVVSGERCETLRAVLAQTARRDGFTPDIPYSANYAGAYKERQYDAAARLYNALGIERGEKARRAEAFMQNYEFYNAPHVAFLCLPEFGGIREAADLGMYAQTL